MRYMVSVQDLRDVSVPRATAAGAVRKAAKMLGDGMKQIRITDTQSGRTYGCDEFHLLGKKTASKA
jgi:hypothetical protein